MDLSNSLFSYLYCLLGLGFSFYFLSFFVYYLLKKTREKQLFSYTPFFFCIRFKCKNFFLSLDNVDLCSVVVVSDSTFLFRIFVSLYSFVSHVSSFEQHIIYTYTKRNECKFMFSILI